MGRNEARRHLSRCKQVARARQQGDKASATQKKSEAGQIMLNQTRLPCFVWEAFQAQTEGVFN